MINKDINWNLLKYTKWRICLLSYSIGRTIYLYLFLNVSAQLLKVHLSNPTTFIDSLITLGNYQPLWQFHQWPPVFTGLIQAILSHQVCRVLHIFFSQFNVLAYHFPTFFTPWKYLSWIENYSAPHCSISKKAIFLDVIGEHDYVWWD